MRIFKGILFLVFLFTFGNHTFADLGTSENEPAQSCYHIYNDKTKNGGQVSSVDNGLYWIQNSNMTSAEQYYCNIERGGWTLMFQRRGGTENKNTENCGENLNGFLNNTCGRVSNIAYRDSYSSNVKTAFERFQPNEYMNIQFDASMNPDTDEAYIIYTKENIFPNTEDMENIQLDNICDINGVNCDKTEIFWQYTGDSWPVGGFCNANRDGKKNHRGSYGYCTEGISSKLYLDRAYPDPNLGRKGYDEVKLWNYSSSSANYMERMFIRNTEEQFPPYNIYLSNEQINENMVNVGNLSSDDLDSTEHTYTLVDGEGSEDNDRFNLTSKGVLSFKIAPDYENPEDLGDTKSNNTYTVRIRSTDNTSSTGLYLEKFFVITVNDVDDTAPITPTSAPDLTLDTDSGKQNDDNITQNTELSFTVQCTEQESKIQLYSESTKIGEANCSTVGEITIKANTLSEGIHTITYTEQDKSGNESNHSPNLEITIDETKPNLQFENNKNGIFNELLTEKNKSNYVVSGQCELNGILTITIQQGKKEETKEVNCQNGKFTNGFDVSQFLDEDLYVSAIQQDIAGNIGKIDSTIRKKIEGSSPVLSIYDYKIDKNQDKVKPLKEKTGDNKEVEGDNKNKEIGNSEEKKGQVDKGLFIEINGEKRYYSINDRKCVLIDNLLDDKFKQGYKTHFGDISQESKQIQRAIIQLEKTGVVHGKKLGVFSPESNITRAEFLSIVLQSHCYNVYKKAKNLPFRDMQNLNTWQARVVQVAYDNKIISGYKDNTFRPNAFISNIEALAIIMKMREITIENKIIRDSFIDKKATWQGQPLALAEYLGVLYPKNTEYRFYPNRNIKRGEILEILFNIMKLYK